MRVARTIQHQMTGQLMGLNWKRIWQKKYMLSQTLPSGTEKNHKKTQDSWSRVSVINPGSPKYEAEVQTTWQWRLMPATFSPNAVYFHDNLKNRSNWWCPICSWNMSYNEPSCRLVKWKTSTTIRKQSYHRVHSYSARAQHSSTNIQLQRCVKNTQI
jgi:hypothetical protein